MMKLIKLVLPLFFLPAIIFTSSVSAEATGNRYNLPSDYKSEVSAAEAYILTNVKHEDDDEDEDHSSEHKKVIIIDVRTVEEYVAGHPNKAYNIPFPHIQSRPNRTIPPYIGQNPKDFFDYVAELIPDRTTPILTLCRTGYRSVLAANILSNPSAWVPEYAGEPVRGYTNVRNIWQGFVGNYKTFTDPVTGETFDLDLNNDGVLSDVDKDGWSNFQGLPYSIKLRPRLLYQPYIGLYYQ